jgi:lipid A 3-O-deacylase
MNAAPRRWSLPIAAALCAPCVALAQSEREASTWLPDGALIQVGHAVRDTRTVTAGLMWQWERRWPLWGGELGGYWELALGHWQSTRQHGSPYAIVTQLGLTPTWRWRPQAGTSPWFVEAAIGINVMTPIYENRDRRFSTAFNFGDHVAIGRHLDARGRHEIALRYEHFSNGGVRRPNPGENFWQLRYAARWI